MNNELFRLLFVSIPATRFAAKFCFVGATRCRAGHALRIGLRNFKAALGKGIFHIASNTALQLPGKMCNGAFVQPQCFDVSLFHDV
jgi:hypothetical protein